MRETTRLAVGMLGHLKEQSAIELQHHHLHKLHIYIFTHVSVYAGYNNPPGAEMWVTTGSDEAPADKGTFSYGTRGEIYWSKVRRTCQKHVCRRFKNARLGP